MTVSDHALPEQTLLATATPPSRSVTVSPVTQLPLTETDEPPTVGPTRVGAAGGL